MVRPLAKQRVSRALGYASLACSLSFWLDLGVGSLYIHLKLEGLKWLIVYPIWKWVIIEGFAVLLAILATAFRSKLWQTAMPVSVLMFLLTMYIMGS